MAHTINLRTNELGYIKLYGICDWKKVILPSNIVVPDFNVCTNTYFLALLTSSLVAVSKRCAPVGTYNCIYHVVYNLLPSQLLYLLCIGYVVMIIDYS